MTFPSCSLSVAVFQLRCIATSNGKRLDFSTRRLPTKRHAAPVYNEKGVKFKKGMRMVYIQMIGVDITSIPDNASSDLKSRVQNSSRSTIWPRSWRKWGGRRSSFRQVVLGILAVCLFGQHYEVFVEAEKCVSLVGIFRHVARWAALIREERYPVFFWSTAKRYAVYTTVM